MYKHILIPTDGSSLSQHAITSAVTFAKKIGARLTGMHVIPLEHPDLLQAWMHRDPDWITLRQALFEKFADRYLDFINNAASAAGVPAICKLVRDQEPYNAIIKTAEQCRCDLIFMASHGWRGDRSYSIGSETQKVLSHSKLPVLIYTQQSTMH